MTVRFSASNMDRLMACPASANLDKAILGWVDPDVDDMAGAKGAGSRRHAMLDPIMGLSRKDIEGFAKILQYVADLRATRRFKVLVEHQVTATWLETKPKTTVDLGLFVQDEIHIIDYKWGKIPVEVVDNKQLLYYAVCLAGLAPMAKGVWLHILQPPADYYESWFADTNVLSQFMVEAQAAEAKIIAGDVTFGPSDKGCMFCPANPHSRSDKGRPFCPTMLQILYPATVDEDAILGLI